MLEIPLGFLVWWEKQKWKGRMETIQWVTEMVTGAGDNGMDSALWLFKRKGTAGMRRQAFRRVPARTFSLLQFLWFIVFV